MNIYLHELRAYRGHTISWTLALVGLSVIFLSFFPTIAAEAEEFKKLLEGFPEAVRVALGLSLENIGSLVGFYSYTFLYISLCGAIQAMNLGTSIISKEIRDKTADFLLTKPITRTQIMSSKLLAALTMVVFTNIFFLGASFVTASVMAGGEFSLKIFIMISLTLLFLQLMFLALGVIVSVVLTNIKSVLSVSLGTVFTFFFIGAIVANSGETALRYFTPFKYFDLAYIMQNESYELSFVIAALLLIVTTIPVSFYVYSKKDIHAV